jgi:hypothetical protein
MTKDGLQGLKTMTKDGLQGLKTNLFSLKIILLTVRYALEKIAVENAQIGTMVNWKKSRRLKFSP